MRIVGAMHRHYGLARSRREPWGGETRGFLGPTAFASSLLQSTEGEPPAGGSVLRTVLGVSERFRMTSRYRASIRKKYLGVTLVLSGVLFWVLVVAVPLTPFHVALASLGHVEKQSLGVV